jgi:Na+/phosphate symporter
VEALDLVLGLCQEMRKNEVMCRRVHERMKSYLGELERLTDKDERMLRNNRVLAKYADTVSGVIRFLREHRGQSLLKRLAHQRKVVDQLQRFHEQLDKLLNIAHITEMRRWREQLQERPSQTGEAPRRAHQRASGPPSRLAVPTASGGEAAS